MKQMPVLLFVILICLNSCAKKDISPNPLRVKTAVLEFYEEDTITIQYSYNEQGLLQQEVQTVNGEPDSSIAYTYDSFGNVIQKDITHSDGTQIIVEHFLTLDEENRVIYQENYSNTELTDCQEITYDNKGNQIELESTLIRQGKDQTVHSQMTYDTKGNLTKKVTQWRDDPSMGGTTQYTYEKGRLISEEVYAPAGWQRGYTEYSYNESGLIQTAMEYKGNGTLQSKTIITSDEYGNPLHYAYYSYTGKIPGSGDDIADKVCTYTYEWIE